MADQSNDAMDTASASAAYIKQAKRERNSPVSSPDSVKDKVRKIERNLEGEMEPDYESETSDVDSVKSYSGSESRKGGEGTKDDILMEICKTVKDVRTSMDKQEQQLKDQEKLLKETNAKIDKINQDRKADLAQLKDLRTDFNKLVKDVNGMKLNIDSQLGGLDKRVQTLEVNAVQQVDLTPVINRLETVEKNAGSVEPQFPALIVKGLAEKAAENEDSLRRSCQDMINSLQVAARVKKATRIGGQRPGAPGANKKPRLVKMSIGSLPDLKVIMKNKRKLDATPAYKDVFIEPDKPGDIRKMEFNMRQIAKELPDLEYRKGQLTKKNQERDEGGRGGEHRRGGHGRRGGRY